MNLHEGNDEIQAKVNGVLKSTITQVNCETIVYDKRSSRDGRMLAEVRVAGTCQLTGNRTHLQAEQHRQP